jgi:hypothetical protein
MQLSEGDVDKVTAHGYSCQKLMWIKKHSIWIQNLESDVDKLTKHMETAFRM